MLPVSGAREEVVCDGCRGSSRSSRSAVVYFSFCLMQRSTQSNRSWNDYHHRGLSDHRPQRGENCSVRMDLMRKPC